MHSSAHLLHNNLPPKPLPITVAQNPLCNFAYPPKPIILRRDLAFSSLLLFMIGPHTHESLRAETTSTVPDKAKIPQEKAFLDVSINGEPIGRIIIELYNDTVPVGSERFGILVSGAAGISYRRKEFVKIMPNYIQNGGLRSYGVDADIARKMGSNFSVGVTLADELDRQNEHSYKGTKNVARSVSIILRDPLKPSPKLKLIARKGKLEIDEEEVGKDPNGTEFVIVTKDSPELDGIALVVGRVIEGMDVVERISGVKTVQENTSSPYFRVIDYWGRKGVEVVKVPRSIGATVDGNGREPLREGNEVDGPRCGCGVRMNAAICAHVSSKAVICALISWNAAICAFISWNAAICAFISWNAAICALISSTASICARISSNAAVFASLLCCNDDTCCFT